MQAWIFLSLVVLITAGGYGGYGYGNNHDDDQCDFGHRDKYGVPKNLVPADSELVLLVHGEGYRAYVFDKSTKKWTETGRQVKLTDPKTKQCVGSISADATTEEDASSPVKYQYSYFADGSFAIREGAKVNQSNPCDKYSAPTAAYEISGSSDSEGLLTGVTHVVVFDTNGGISPKHLGKEDQQVECTEESANYAFYRSAAPEVNPLPKGHSYSYGNYGDEQESNGDKHDRYYYAPKSSHEDHEDEEYAPPKSHGYKHESNDEEDSAPKSHGDKHDSDDEEEYAVPTKSHADKHESNDEEESAPHKSHGKHDSDDEEESAPPKSHGDKHNSDDEEEYAPPKYHGDKYHGDN